jgi:glycerol uptake facilitator-like aquaporin
LESNNAYGITRRLVAESLGTAFLLATVVGSGIMGERLSGGDVALALLANSLATGAVLSVLILSLEPISGAHLNPAVTLALAIERKLSSPLAAAYVAAQITGAFVGVLIAHGMFGLPMFLASRHTRNGASQLLSEFVATFGLLLIIACCSRFRPSATAFAVGAYIAGAYWFTASTSFANPAVTMARGASDTFAGIRPVDAPGFIVVQLIAACAATFFCRWLNAELLPEIIAP